MLNPATARLASLQYQPVITRHWDQWNECRACGLCKTRDKVVLWRGWIPCDVLFVGEAPGPRENKIGVPFIGPAGSVFNDAVSAVRDRIKASDQKMIHPKGPHFSFAVTNILACFPQTDKGEIREPNQKEVAACQPRLKQFIKVAKPKLIVCLGKVAAVHIKNAIPVDFKDIPILDVLHPSAVLRAEKSKYGSEFSRLSVPLYDGICKHILNGGG